LLDWLGSGGASGSFPQNTVDAVLWRLAAVEDSQLFDPSAEDIAARLGRPGAKSVIELADLDDATKSVVVAVVMRRLMKWAAPAQRRRKLAAISGDDLPSNEDVAPRIWVLIDEAHLVCPAGAETAARPIIVDYVKRGRDAGLSLVLATQQPSALDTGAISQNDLVFIHKLTIDPDISAATARMPARPPTSVTKLPRATELRGVDEIARSLDAGQALLADSESSRAFIMQSRPRVSPHGGGEPTL
jgi:DNA helicase HerA-like ATPase